MSRAPAFADPDRLVRSVFRSSWKDDDRPEVDEWADENRVLPVKGSPRPGKWRTSMVPYLREPMRDYTDPSVGQIVLMTGSQIGKTEMLITLLGYTVCCDPLPMMLVLPTKDLAMSINKERLTPGFRETPAIAEHMGSSPRDTQAMHIAFDSCTMQLMGANSASGLASRPIGRAFGDELDKWPQQLKGRGGHEGGALELLRQRLDAFDFPKLVLASTPTEEGIGIHSEYLRSDQGRYFVPCPHCGAFQWLHFYADGAGGVRWTGGVGEDLDDADHAALVDQVRKTAWYSCEACDGRIESHHKHRMLAAGVWVRQGQEITPDGIVTGEPVTSRIRGYQLSKLYSPFLTFGDVASRFVQRRGMVDRAFVNGDLGEPWREVGERAENDVVIRLSQEAIEGGETPYKLGDVPPGVVVLTGSIDVQNDVCYWQIDGWGEAEAHWLIDYGVETCPEVIARDAKAEGDAETLAALGRDNWALMDRIIDRRLTSTENGQAVGVNYWIIDSGARTGEVYRFAGRHKGRVLPAKGSGQIAQPWQVTNSDPSKFLMDTSVPVLIVNSNHWRDQAWSRMHRQPPAWGAWRWPKDVGREYSRQLAAEQRVRKTLPGGKFRTLWELRPGRKDNHWWDCTVQALAFADHIGLRTLNANAAPKRVHSGGLTPGGFAAGGLTPGG